MRVLLISIVAYLTFCCQAETSPPKLIGTIPFQFEDEMIFIKVKVNDGPEKKFLFDTGASVTLISQSLGDELGLKNGSTVGNIGATGNGSMEAFSNNTIAFEDISIAGVTLMKNLLKLPKSSPLSEKFEGAICYDILSRFIVSINYDEKKLELYSFGNIEGDRFGASHSIDLSYNIPSISASLEVNENSYTGDFLLDTGSQMAIILNSPFSRRNNIRGGLTKSISIIKKAGVSEVSSEFIIFRGQRLKVFDQDFGSPPAALSTAKSGALASNGFQGIIGNPVLKRFNMTLDYSNQKIYLIANDLYKKSFAADCTGISFDSKRGDKKLIAEFITAGSSAMEAGLKAGDELVAINGKVVQDFDSEAFFELIRQSGRKLQIEYRRGDENYQVELITKELI